MENQKVQFGQSMTADFKNNIWLFKMNEDFKITAGTYALIPADLYNELRNELIKIKELLEKEKAP